MLVEADAAALRKARRGSPAQTSGDTAGRPAPAAGAAALGQVLDQAVRELRQLFGGSAGVAAGPLTPRELEVLRLLAEGLPNKEIAYRLALSTGTVKAHTAAIYRKLDALNRTEAVTRAREAGLL
jgi:DNA-binding NarL/FixJ family response regulator